MSSTRVELQILGKQNRIRFDRDTVEPSESRCSQQGSCKKVSLEAETNPLSWQQVERSSRSLSSEENDDSETWTHNLEIVDRQVEQSLQTVESRVEW